MGVSADLKQFLKKSAIRPLLQRRRLHVYCLGAPKTGTTSVSMMMRANYRSEHEPLGAGTVDLLRAVIAGGPQPDWSRALRKRDRELYLDMESSHPMTIVAGRLAEAFPRARFVLVYREPRAWLNSIINMRLNRGFHRFDPLPPLSSNTVFRHMNEWYYRRLHPVHPPAEQLLATLGVYTLDGYLSGWALHNRLVLDQIPSDRLLVLEISDLTRHPERLANFLGIPVSTLDLGRSHAHRGAQDHRILEQLDQGLLDDKIEQHCVELLRSLQGLRNLTALRYSAPAALTPTAVAASRSPVTW